MNILYIDHYAGGPDWGMEYRPFYLSREWVRLGHQVTVVASSQSHVRSRAPSIGSRFTHEVVDGVDYIWCETPKYSGNGIGRVLNILVFLLRLCQYRQWLNFRPDIVIASSTYPADIYFARRLARKFGSKLVWEVHDLWPLSPIELGGMSRWHPFIVWMQHAENLACRSADVVVSMLPRADLHLVHHGMTQSKYVYIPNGVDLDEWASASDAALPPKHGAIISQARRENRLLVLYAGSHGVANALDVLVDAAKLTIDDQVTWLLVGSGPEKDNLIRRVANESINNIHFLDPVHKSVIPTLLSMVDILYIGWNRHALYRFGISPNKLNDYMASGTPIVHGVEAVNDPVAETNCGISIPPQDASALAEAVQQLCLMPEADRVRMGSRGRAKIETEQTFPILAAHFLEAIKAR